MGDYFSKQASFYSRYRPAYPEELFDYVASLCRERNLAWDCATGNGQSAVSLSSRFRKVYATDISENQIAHAFQKDNIAYEVGHAEHCSLQNASADAITVSTALHWFDIPAFFKEADRVLKKDGLLAIWSYAGCRINQEIDTFLDVFAYDTLGDYWPKEAELMWKQHYETVAFPYPLLQTPEFTAHANYTLEDLLNYLRSWSARQRYMDQHAIDPVDALAEQLLPLWGNAEERKEIRWPLLLKFSVKK